MPASVVALSDLHLGYDRSVLRDPAARVHLAEALASACGGSTDRLVLCGDAFEACVPRDAGDLDERGYPRSAGEDARSFFGELASRVQISLLAIVWGNHDLAMGRRLRGAMGLSEEDEWHHDHVLRWSNGLVEPGADNFLASMVGPAALEKFFSIRCCYPNLVLGRRWPYVVFHHGHLLDDLVLGREEPLKYELLRPVVGTGRPAVCLPDAESVAEVSRATGPFVAGLWPYASAIREHEWALLRRGEDARCCPSFPSSPGDAPRVVSGEVPGAGLGKNLPWYARLLQADSSTPPPIGGGEWPSYLVYGHDHGGGDTEVAGYDGRRWRCVNLGGWTNNAGRSPTPHCHVLVWHKTSGGAPAAEPELLCVRF